MRDVVIQKHYKKYRKQMGWSTAILKIYLTYKLDQYDVFYALGYKNGLQNRLGRDCSVVEGHESQGAGRDIRRSLRSPER